LPETEEAPNHFAFSVRNKGKLKGFGWVWMERVAPKKPRVPQPSVIALRVASLDDKDFLLALDPARFFTEPHYNGFPAVLVRLPAVTRRAQAVDHGSVALPGSQGAGRNGRDTSASG
jgi:hypothetical protein